MSSNDELGGCGGFIAAFLLVAVLLYLFNIDLSDYSDDLKPRDEYGNIIEREESW